jgi:hypothetical protein
VATPIQAPKKTGNSILQRLPRLSTSVWLIIIFCLFLVGMIPLASGYLAQASKQQALRTQVSQLQTQYDSVKAKMTGQASLSTEVGKLKAEAEAATKLYEEGCDNLVSSQILMDLAWKNDLTITSMSTSPSQGKILAANYPAFTYSLSLSGQVAGFQNFLIAVDKRFPSSMYQNITITPATVEGNLDTASIGIQILCNAQ